MAERAGGREQLAAACGAQEGPARSRLLFADQQATAEVAAGLGSPTAQGQRGPQRPPVTGLCQHQRHPTGIWRARIWH